jgi:transposase-like protein
MGGMSKRKQYSDEERASWLRKWRSSGESGAKFAHRHGIHKSTLYRWSSTQEVGERKCSRVETGFAEVKLRGAELERAGHLEICLSNGRTLRLLGLVEPAQLRAVLQVLES